MTTKSGYSRFSQAAVIAALLFMGSCARYDKPLIVTGDAEDITHRSVTLNGQVIDDGGREVTFRGFVWGLHPYIDLYNNSGQVSLAGGTGSFSADFDGLTPGTVYYVRAWAVNSQGTSYGSSVSFTTSSHTPRVHTREAWDISTRSATAGGAISSAGGEPVTVRGVVWGAEPGPTTEQNKGITTDGEGTGSWESRITGLQHNTRYYVRAYATNSTGTAYGREVTFTTDRAVPPAVTTVTPREVRARTATSGGRVTHDGGVPVRARGVVVSTSESPRIDHYEFISRDGAGIGSFTSELSGLQYGTEYFVRSWATNEAGTGYGPQETFTTPVPALPEPAIQSVTETESTRAELILSVDDDGYADLIQQGIVWSRQEKPTLENYDGILETDGALGRFTGTMTGLNPGTVYYIRSWATNEAGTGYSDQLEIRTPAELPAVRTVQLISYTETTALFAGSLDSDGGDPGTARGLAIGTAPDPSVDVNDGMSGVGTGTGDFTGGFTELTPGQTYYVRAWASNEAGVTYGRQARFTTVGVCGEEVDFTYSGEEVTYGTVSGAGGACWMDRNLGAARVATSRRDEASFGHLYQWGRSGDGHHERDSEIVFATADDYNPGHGNFIAAEGSIWGWHKPLNTDLWQGDGAPNDVCPPGWRVPTAGELQAEKESWRRQSRRQAYRSPLRLPTAGMRSINGKVIDEGRRGHYWSSSTEDDYPQMLIIRFWMVDIGLSGCAAGRSVRCIREEERTDVEWLW